MKQIICDEGSLDVILGGERVFKVHRGEIETVLCLHEQKSFPQIVKRLLGLPNLTYFKGVTLMSRDLSVILDQNDQGLMSALDWLKEDGWAIDEAVGRSFRNAGIRTTVTKSDKVRADSV